MGEFGGVRETRRRMYKKGQGAQATGTGEHSADACQLDPLHGNGIFRQIGEREQTEVIVLFMDEYQYDAV